MEEKKDKTSAPNIEARLIDFATRILDLVEKLPERNMVAKHLGGQLMRSGTSPALNYGEARAAESRVDFIHKMKICLKELRETHICLKIIEKRPWMGLPLTALLDETNQLISIFVTSLKTASGKGQ